MNFTRLDSPRTAPMPPPSPTSRSCQKPPRECSAAQIWVIVSLSHEARTAVKPTAAVPTLSRRARPLAPRSPLAASVPRSLASVLGLVPQPRSPATSWAACDELPSRVRSSGYLARGLHKSDIRLRSGSLAPKLLRADAVLMPCPHAPVLASWDTPHNRRTAPTSTRPRCLASPRPRRRLRVRVARPPRVCAFDPRLPVSTNLAPVALPWASALRRRRIRVTLRGP